MDHLFCAHDSLKSRVFESALQLKVEHMMNMSSDECDIDFKSEIAAIANSFRVRTIRTLWELAHGRLKD